MRNAIEKKFANDWQDEWDPTIDTKVARIPIRTKDGSVKEINIKRPQDFPSNWTKVLRGIFGEGPSARGKPSRHVDFELRYPLIIQPLLTRKDLIVSRFEDYNKLFDPCIAQANKAACDGLGASVAIDRLRLSFAPETDYMPVT